MIAQTARCRTEFETSWAGVATQVHMLGLDVLPSSGFGRGGKLTYFTPPSTAYVLTHFLENLRVDI